MKRARKILMSQCAGLVLMCSALHAQQANGPVTFTVPDGWARRSLGAQGALITSGDAYVRIVGVPGGGKDEQLVERVAGQVGAQWRRFTRDHREVASLAGHRGVSESFHGINPGGVQATMGVVAAPFGSDAYMLIMSAPSAEYAGDRAAFQQIEDSLAVNEVDGPDAGAGADAPAAGGSDDSGAHAGLPERAAGDGLKTIDESGGRVLFASVGKVPSVAGTFRAGLVKTRDYFDSSPQMLSAIGSKDGRVAMAVFHASLQGSPVTGLAVAAYDPASASHFALVFDSPEHLATSLPAMMRRVQTLTEQSITAAHPGGGSIDLSKYVAAAAHVPLKHTEFPDGTASVGIAPGFTTQIMQTSVFGASAADGSYVRCGVMIPMMDPRGQNYQLQLQIARLSGQSAPRQVPGQFIVEYDTDPFSAWKKFLEANSQQKDVPYADPQAQKLKPLGDAGGWTSENVTGTMTVQGEPFVFSALFSTRPPAPAGGSQFGTGYWPLSITILAAPARRAAADFPALIAMQRSVRVDQKALTNVTNQLVQNSIANMNQWLAANKAAGDEARDSSFEHSMANARAASDAMDRSSAGFIHYIQGNAVVQHNPTGAHATMDSGLAGALEHADPTHFSPVPLSQYIKGIDY